MNFVSIIASHLNDATYFILFRATISALHNIFFTKIHLEHISFNFGLMACILSWIIHFIFNRIAIGQSPVNANDVGLLKTGGISNE